MRNYDLDFLKRFSMVIEDGTVTQLNVEEPGDFKVSSAEHMLGQM